jgi:hypothetical protein
MVMSTMDAISPAPPPTIRITPITCRLTFCGDQVTANRKIAPARMRKTLTPALTDTTLPFCHARSVVRSFSRRLAVA